MIRIIFDNGEIADCENIDKIYVEQYEMDKVTIVGKMEDEDVRESNRRTKKSNKDIKSEASID